MTEKISIIMMNEQKHAVTRSLCMLRLITACIHYQVKLIQAMSIFIDILIVQHGAIDKVEKEIKRGLRTIENNEC